MMLGMAKSIMWYHFEWLSNRQPTVQVCEEEKDKRQDLYIKARSYQASLDEHYH